MAKPKFPKKGTVAKVEVPAASSLVSSPNASLTMAEASAAVPPTPTKKLETKPETTKKAARKPQVVRTEPRANLVPINIEDEIRRFAYLLSERRGFQPGYEAEDWLAAELEVRQRYHQQSA